MTMGLLAEPAERRCRRLSSMDRQPLLAALFRHREAVLILLGAPVAVCALRGGGLKPGSGLSGAALVAGGVLLRLTTVRRIGRGARVFRPHASAGLIASGPYRWSRNPLYLAAALMLCGLGLLAGADGAALALIPATLLAYTPVVLAEEHALAQLFGDGYRAYCTRVPRWIGRSRPMPADPHPRAFVDWSEVFRREKALVPGAAAGAIAIAALRAQWIPSRAILAPIERAGLGTAQLVSVAALIAVAVGAVKVELHQRRRTASRAARASVAPH
jgi:protein-S-isoprenylcysteine O-methyltransferase Ste14